MNIIHLYAGVTENALADHHLHSPYPFKTPYLLTQYLPYLPSTLIHVGIHPQSSAN